MKSFAFSSLYALASLCIIIFILCIMYSSNPFGSHGFVTSILIAMGLKVVLRVLDIGMYKKEYLPLGIGR